MPVYVTAEGIVPVIAKRHLINNITGRCWHCAKKNVADEDLCELNSKGKIKKELCDQILATIQEDTRPIS